jgi:eukaryotic-like serine/threonine-protein kinase
VVEVQGDGTWGCFIANPRYTPALRRHILALNPGTRLGSYEIVTPIGAGGMGEVYGARDTTLDRDVAIKVLPEAFGADAAHRARFEREAKLVATLSHPNILAIYDFETNAGMAYAVMELLHGESLRSRLAGGALPLRKVIDYAGQVASGLAAAHEGGVVHRDLKPENIFITTDGRVKVLDFGLAALVDNNNPDPSHSPTVLHHTRPGTVLGTVGYMSPEQVRGQPADHRSDIFSLGCVLFEMLTGQRAFQRETAAETMTAILREDPPSFSGMTPPVPAAVERLVLHCLEKSPAERFQSARDLAFDLQVISGLSTMSQAVATVASTRGRRYGLAAAAAVAAVAVVGAAYIAGWRVGRISGSRGPSYQQLTFARQMIFAARFSPDGQTVVYSAAAGGNSSEVFAIRPDHPEPRPLGLRGAHVLSVSSRGELALLTKARYHFHHVFTGTLSRMPLEGGAPREILENVREADWSPDGERLAIIREVKGKDRLEYPIGTVLHEGAGYISDVRVSPDGDRVAFFEHPKKWDDRGSVNVVDTARTRRVLADGFWGEQGLVWAKGGDALYFSASDAGFEYTARAVTLSGGQRVVLEGPGALFLLDVSRDGRWLVTRDEKQDAVWALAPGAQVEQDLSLLDHSWQPTLSDDGTQVLFTAGDPASGLNYVVCLRRTDGSPVVRLGQGDALDLSHDGKWALSLVPTSPPQLVMFPTGPGEPTRLARGALNDYDSASFFPDATKILVCGSEPGHAGRCYVQDVGGGSPRPVTPEGTRQGRISPDGKLVLVQSVTGERLLISIDGGEAKPVPSIRSGETVAGWSADGQSVFVFEATEIPTRVERVDVRSGRRVLFREIAPLDRSGYLHIEQVSLAKHANAYTYGVVRRTSQLYLVQGAR